MIVPFRCIEDVARAVPLVQQQYSIGQMIAYPTETLYGLGASLNDHGIDTLSRLKGREGEKPFLVLAASIEMMEEWGFELNPRVRELAAHFWPGPLTMVLPNHDQRMPGRLRGASGGVAVRWSSHHGATALTAALGQPLLSTSANRAGAPAALTIDEVSESFPEATAMGDLLLLDGGQLVSSLPSTVIDCTAEMKILREGAIPGNELHRYLQR